MSEAVTTEQSAAATTTAAAPDPKLAAGGGEQAAGASPAVEAAVPPAGEQQAAAVVPPDYSTLKLPEGTAADDGMAAAFKAVATDAKLTPEAAQSFIDKIGPQITEHVAKLRQDYATEVMAMAQSRLQEWENTVRADPEIGGNKLDGTLANIARTMEQFGNPAEIRQALGETGAGSNPVLIKWFNKMATALGEGRLVVGGGPAKVGKPGNGAALNGPDGFYNHPSSQPAGSAAA